MGDELAATFARLLGPDDRVILCDPVYFGGTVDRSAGSERIVALIAGAKDSPAAEYVAARADCASRLVELAMAATGPIPPRIVVMGARDDTLSAFAADLLARLP